MPWGGGEGVELSEFRGEAAVRRSQQFARLGFRGSGLGLRVYGSSHPEVPFLALCKI